MLPHPHAHRLEIKRGGKLIFGCNYERREKLTEALSNLLLGWMRSEFETKIEVRITQVSERAPGMSMAEWIQQGGTTD